MLLVLEARSSLEPRATQATNAFIARVHISDDHAPMRSWIVCIAAALAALPACAASEPAQDRGAGGADTSHGGGGAGGTDESLDAGATDGGATGDPTTCAEAADRKSYLGCDFWPTVVANNVWSIFDYAVVVANPGLEPVQVTVERNGQVVSAALVQPSGLAPLYLPWVPELKGPDVDNCGTASPLKATVRADGGAYHLVASKPVAVYQFNALEYQGVGGPLGKSWSQCPGNQFCNGPNGSGFIGCYSFSNDASLLLPTTALTGNYRITGLKGWAAAKMGAYFAVTGTADATTVTVNVGTHGKIVAGGGIATTSAGAQVQFMVNAGDVVEILGASGTDLSGSLVKASAPVQVIAGVPCIQSPIGTNACDHVEESVFPAETLGQHYFVTVPTAPTGKAVGHVVRLYGNADGTSLSYPSGKPVGAPDTLAAGDVVDLGIVSDDFEILGTHEFAVGTFMLGAEKVDPNGSPQRGDPSQSLSTAVEQFRTKYVFLAPGDYDMNFVDIVEPMGTKLVLDGGIVAIAPKAIGGTGFGVVRVPLGQGIGGAHVLTASAPVGIQVMGYGSYTSYQYPGGLDLKAIAPPPPK
jgi:hypothetical protein